MNLTYAMWAETMKLDAAVVVDLANFAFTEGQLSEEAKELAERLAAEYDLRVLWSAK